MQEAISNLTRIEKTNLREAKHRVSPWNNPVLIVPKKKDTLTVEQK